MADGSDPREVGVGADGVRVAADDDRIFDLLLDGARVWSFRADAGAPAPDTPAGRVLVAWPQPLHGFLHGVAEVAVRDQAGTTVASAEVRFDDTDQRARVADIEGHPMVLDSKGRLSLPFVDAEALGPLLQRTHDVLDVLAEAGVHPFLAYGTLLGAVREGDFIGHDNDIDLGYVSEQRQPVDVVRESFRLERAGMTVERYSGAGFKVLVHDGSGIARWVDVFGGFWHGDRLALMGELLTPFERDWVLPLSSVRLAGEEFPAPAQPERLLEAMYGPGWRVPDPTFSFESGTAARRRLNLWFRGIRQQRNMWDRHNSGQRHHAPPMGPHQIARALHRAEPEAVVVDAGCGRGQDAFWLARQGHRVVAFDYSEWGTAFLRRQAAAEGLPVEYHTVNLLELRQALGWGARLSRLDSPDSSPRPRVMLARHLLDALPPLARDGFWRLASMTLRGGGRMYVECFASATPRPRTPESLVWEVDPDELVADAERVGARVLETSRHRPGGHELGWTTAQWDPVPETCRMVLEWT